MTIVDDVANILLARHVVLPIRWIATFLETECGVGGEGRTGSRVTPANNLAATVYNHVLNSDLRAVKQTRKLPPNLTNERNTVLNGYFLLQMDSVMDISQSAYNQYTKLRGIDDSNARINADERETEPSQQVEIKSKSCSVIMSINRMLRLMLTDGFQEVRGMEWKTIPFFSTAVTPGCKILVHGSIECRRGVLFLCKENTRLLGGKVDRLMETNGQLALLLRELNIDTSADQGQGNHRRNEVPAVASLIAPQRQPLQEIQCHNGLDISKRTGISNEGTSAREPRRELNHASRTISSAGTGLPSGNIPNEVQFPTFASEREEEEYWINFEFDLYARQCP